MYLLQLTVLNVKELDRSQSRRCTLSRIQYVICLMDLCGALDALDSLDMVEGE